MPRPVLLLPLLSFPPPPSLVRTSPSGTIPARHPNLFPGTGLWAAHPPITSYRRRHERARLVSPIARHDLLCIKSHFSNVKSRSALVGLRVSVRSAIRQGTARQRIMAKLGDKDVAVQED
ncbi:hypothetical protein E2C01_016536 [Portunus trituberculatus]|uniref:Uncharacterized protein n=1 Tax=Portunus trituberculatus TaxID=210409 RepID=A0A5B7DQT5_PORTR|nr:hypothetical protein [Portunus trituberculatus]